MTFLLVASCDSIQEKIEADQFLIDSSDATLYRVLNDGTEEFLNIQGNVEAEKFGCWHQDDIKKWARRLVRECN